MNRAIEEADRVAHGIIRDNGYEDFGMDLCPVCGAEVDRG